MGSGEDAINEALAFFNRAHNILRVSFGPEHLCIASCLSNQATIYNSQGYYRKAEPLYALSLRIQERKLGPNHPIVAQSLNNLAEIYRLWGQKDEAEPLFRRALSISEASLGPHHPDVATFLSNLALIYRMQNRFDESEQYYKRALSIRENIFHSNHPHIGHSLNGLAQLYKVMDNFQKSEAFFRRAQEIWKISLSPNHPDQGLILNNLAELYIKMGLLNEAEPYLKKSLIIREAAFGTNHPDVAQTIRNMAELYFKMGQFKKAEPFFQRSLKIREEFFGLSHPLVVCTIHSYSKLLFILGRITDSIMMEARVDKVLRDKIAKEIANDMISKQNLQLNFNEAVSVEQEVKKRIEYPETAKGPIIITRTVIVEGGGTVSSPISDERLKKNVRSIKGALDKVIALKGIYFNWKKDEDNDLLDKNLSQVGFIAQDVEKVIPEIVYTNAEGIKGIHYANLVAVLTEAIKEQQIQIEELKQRLADKKMTG